jgi:hypothetical protein
VRKGQITENLEMINQGLGWLREALNTLLRNEAQFSIAEVALGAGDNKALFEAVQAMESLGPMGEGFDTWNVQVFKANLLASNGTDADANEAEALFRSCLEYARKWQVKMGELLAASGLARLLARTGRRDEAGTILAEICSWFTEGLDTVPLRAAKELLDEIAHAA